jgi:hypothetical protein
LDRVEEGLHLKGLLKRAVGAQHFGDIEKIEKCRSCHCAGDRDDFHVRECPPQRAGGLQATLIDHQKVHNDQIRRGQPILLERLLSIARFRDVITGLLQCFVNQSTDFLLIIDDEMDDTLHLSFGE